MATMNRAPLLRLLAVGLAVTAVGPAGDEYRYAAQFTKLEQADATGSMNDLLREGRRIPGGPARIPTHEAFEVITQGLGVTVFDAWFTESATRDQEPELVRLEQDLAVTPVAIDS
jgi:hypothetical protein